VAVREAFPAGSLVACRAVCLNHVTEVTVLRFVLTVTLSFSVRNDA
jgi:hypothetical protein